MSRSIIKNSVYNLLKSALTLIFPLLTFSYASRKLLPSGMGQIDFSKSLISILTMLAMLGMKHYGMRECSRVRDDKDKLSKTVKELLAVNIVTTIISYIVLLVLLICFSKIRAYSDTILIYGLMLSLTTAGVEWLYMAVEEFRYIALRTLAAQILAYVLMLLLVHDENDVWIYALVYVISSGGAYLLSFVHSGKIVDYKIKCKLDIKKHIKPLLLLFITGAFIEIYVSLDSVMLGVMSDDINIGYYSASYKISSALCSIILAILQVVVPRISYYAEQGLKKELNELMQKAMSFTIMLDIPVAIGSYMLSDYLVIILSGAEFAPAVNASKILSLRMFIGPINYLLIYNLFVPLKKDVYSVFVTAAAALTDIIINLILIPKYQYLGASVSTVAAEGAIFIIGMIFSRKIVDFSEPFRKTWQYVIAALPIIPACYLLSLLGMNMIVYVALAVSISAVIYFFILLLFKNQLVVEGFNIVKMKFKSK